MATIEKDVTNISDGEEEIQRDRGYSIKSNIRDFPVNQSLLRSRERSMHGREAVSSMGQNKMSSYNQSNEGQSHSSYQVEDQDFKHFAFLEKIQIQDEIQKSQNYELIQNEEDCSLRIPLEELKGPGAF